MHTVLYRINTLSNCQHHFKSVFSLISKPRISLPVYVRCNILKQSVVARVGFGPGTSHGTHVLHYMRCKLYHLYSEWVYCKHIQWTLAYLNLKYPAAQIIWPWSLHVYLMPLLRTSEDAGILTVWSLKRLKYNDCLHRWWITWHEKKRQCY